MTINKNLEKLFSLSYKIQKIQPWNIIDDTKIFAVCFPIDNETSYITLSGKTDEFCEVNIFHGNDGLNNLYDLYNEIPEIDFYRNINGFSIYYEEIEELYDKDILLLDEYGYFDNEEIFKIKFEKYMPGYLPEIPNEDKYIKKITTILEQFIELYDEFKTTVNILNINNGKILTRKFIDNEWITIKENINDEHLFEVLDVNPFDVRRLMRDLKKIDNTWEMDMFYSPNIIKDEDKENLYYPLVFILADLDKTKIIQYTLIDHRNANILSEYFDFLFDAYNNNGNYPSKIKIKCNNLYYGFEDIFKAMKIKIEFVDFLEIIDDFKEDMYFDKSNYDIEILEDKLLSLLESGEITEEDIDDDFINELLKNLELDE